MNVIKLKRFPNELSHSCVVCLVVVLHRSAVHLFGHEFNSHLRGIVPSLLSFPIQVNIKC